jgi:hypothetical protein
MQACASTLFSSTMFGGNMIILVNPKPFCNLSKMQLQHHDVSLKQQPFVPNCID